ncbi:MAG: thiol-disulfide oxidoreductase DCC family protein, partial [Myxococcota bacterium]
LIGAALLPEFLAPGAGGPLAPADFTGAAIDLLFGPLALISRARPWIWTAMLLRLAVGGLPDGGLLLAHLFLFDPGWIRPRLAPRPEILFYDGRCGLCHRAVRFILAEDQTGRAFRFAPLAGETFRRTVPAEIRRGLPDSLVVAGDDGEMRVRARCVSHVLARLGGLWRALGVAGGVIPRSVADALYNSVARVRHRVFSAPGEVCPAVSDEMRRRFDP